MPEWFETTVVIAFAIAAVFFFAKYRETASALHESERMKNRVFKDLDRYRDMPRLRALRDAMLSADALPVDDEGVEHLLLRDGDNKLHHVTLKREVSAVAEGEKTGYTKGGERVELEELE